MENDEEEIEHDSPSQAIYADSEDRRSTDKVANISDPFQFYFKSKTQLNISDLFQFYFESKTQPYILIPSSFISKVKLTLAQH